MNVHTAADLAGGSLAVSEPVTGARHDRAALTLCGWEPILNDTDWIADPGHIGTTLELYRTGR
ncbi:MULTISPECIES: hypothetical protein [unclassified Rathayibacter]|uniref:hypothetical protein n=1 Tax=unclassified Rathayibacter TaxID=2609250 RepID=UPI00188A0EDB|nr:MULTISPECIES: hypothetical protein [unclassified Rathayibacter]MBF4461751.1 hypothetical protein [Rathayibacter sp. VKM Ac-2879]MBF4503162.1 hypothetical protein [Rathayibacter sp. VKM Ac-2878]